MGAHSAIHLASAEAALRFAGPVPCYGSSFGGWSLEKRWQPFGELECLDGREGGQMLRPLSILWSFVRACR